MEENRNDALISGDKLILFLEFLQEWRCSYGLLRKEIQRLIESVKSEEDDDWDIHSVSFALTRFAQENTDNLCEFLKGNQFFVAKVTFTKDSVVEFLCIGGMGWLRKIMDRFATGEFPEAFTSVSQE